MSEILINNKPFYYDELPFNYNGGELNKEVAAKFIHILKQIFDENNIKFFLSCGTLLGAYRDNDFIGHDFDLDLGIFEDDKQAFLNLIPILDSKGIKLCNEWRGVFYTLIYKGITCDFNIFYKALFPYSLYYIGVGEFHFVPRKYIKELKTYKFLGENFWIPTDPEGYLSYLYGKNWRIPQKGRGAVAIPKWMVLEKLFIRVKRKLRYLKCKYITHTEFK